MIAKKWVWTDHIKWQLKERHIPKGLVEKAIHNPDEIVPAKQGRIIYQKMTEDKLIRIVTEGNRLITVYLTDKIKKYLKGEGK